MVSTKSVTPKISIITATYNSAAFIKNCLSSVSNQTFRDFEHILIDGYSRDSTKKFIDNYAKTEKVGKIKVFQTKPRGISHAMNQGIKQARGEYLYFLHSDDSLYSPDTLSLVVSFLQEYPDLDWAYGRIHEIDENGTTIGFPPRLSYFHLPRPWLLPFYNYIPHQAVFMKKDIFARYGGFDESLKSMMDDELWLRLSHITKWDFMPLVVANYSIRKTSQSESKKNKSDNNAEWAMLQARYLKYPTLLLAKAINLLIR